MKDPGKDDVGNDDVTGPDRPRPRMSVRILKHVPITIQCDAVTRDYKKKAGFLQEMEGRGQGTHAKGRPHYHAVQAVVGQPLSAS